MKTDHRVLLWCVVAWMCCIVVNCRVEFFDADGNDLREKDILEKDWIVKDDKINIWEDSYRRKPYLGLFRSENKPSPINAPDQEIINLCKNVCGFTTDTLEENEITCIPEGTTVQCKCIKGEEEKKSFDYNTKQCADCACGDSAKGCSFSKEGVKTCDCIDKFAQRDEECEACDCGDNYDKCSLSEDGAKTCTCKDKFVELKGKCEACDCGDNYDKCSLSEDGAKTCTCKDKFVELKGKCEACDCGDNYEKCSLSEDGKKTCSCKDKFVELKGKCEACDCGGNYEKCSLSEDGKKTCTCKDKFAEQNGKCEACDCGENYETCSLSKDGKKTCTCKDKFAERNGKCEACDCGDNYEKCSLSEDGKKTCTCKDKFAEKNGKCEACDCGKNSEGCSFNNNGTRKCACKVNFAQKGELCEEEACVKKCGVKEDVICKPKENNIECECRVENKKFDSRSKECRIPCVEDSKCTNGAMCETVKDAKFCECQKGTSGDMCEVIKDCTATGKYSMCKGVRGNCTYDPDKEIAVCLCKEGKKLKDKSGYCVVCDCGEHSEDCKFKDDKVQCKCKPGYSDKNGECVECNCGQNSTSCSFSGDKRICECKEGFGDDGGTCKPCSCGENSEGCSFKDGKKTCTCKAKFALKNDTCEVCDCGEHSESCKYEGEKKTCDCKVGFKENNGICKECNCGENSTSCKFENGNKICRCKAGNAQNGEKCEECKCGENTKPCKFENGEKKCDCQDKFAYKEEKCTACECGVKSKGCTFKEENKKECYCEDGYGDHNGKCTVDQCLKKCGVPPENHEEIDCKGDRYGNGSNIRCVCFDDALKFDSTKTKCRETCANHTQCNNSAKCETSGDNKFCNCLKNTDGHRCEILTECGKGQRLEKCTDGRGKCKYDGTREEAFCECPDKTLYDPKEKYCQDKCTKDEECSNNKICFQKKYCSCEEGKTGDNCEIATGCNEKLQKKCESAKAECAFSKTADNFADCVCKDKNLVYNGAENTCVAKFCNDFGCKSPAKCDFDPDTETAYCKCPSGKYYDYNTETCSGPDKCLLKKTPCKENEVCKNGVCKCKGEKIEDKCIIKFCKDGACFKGAKCDEETATCKCEDGKYFTGSSCEDVKCIKDPFGEDCDCPSNMEKNKESKKCEPRAKKPACDKDCGLGYCVEDKCSCIDGISKLHEGKCVLDKNKICASKELKDSSTCLCTGKYKQATKDGITCELVTCSDEVAKQICKDKKATCKMSWTGGNSIGYSCECPAGYTENKEKGICTDSCSVYEIAEKCSLEGQVCYNSYSVPNRETSTCDCAPPFRKTTENCDDVAEFAYFISGIPVMKQRYQMEYGIDYVKLNSDLMQSLSQMYNQGIFDSGYLHDYVEDGDVLKTSVWVRFNQNISGQLNRFKLQAQKFPNGTCEDCDTNLYVWPPYVVLKGSEFNDVKAKSLNLCSADMKNTLCGEEADCKNNYTCFCPRGYKTLEFTIRTVSDKARILRCEKSNVVDLDECALGTHTCPENTTCFKTPGSYICKCKPGYWKSTQDDQKDCVDMCTPSPCEKGTCSMKKDKFNCKCQAGYSGSYCDEMDVNFASAKKSTVVVGAVLGTILIVCVLAALFFYIKKRKSSYSEDFMPAPRQDIASEMRERRPIRGVVNTSYE